MAKNTPTLQTRAKRWGMIAAASMGGLVVLNTLANRNVPLAGQVRDMVRNGF